MRLQRRQPVEGRPIDRERRRLAQPGGERAFGQGQDLGVDERERPRARARRARPRSTGRPGARGCRRLRPRAGRRRSRRGRAGPAASSRASRQASSAAGPPRAGPGARRRSPPIARRRRAPRATRRASRTGRRGPRWSRARLRRGSGACSWSVRVVRVVREVGGEDRRRTADHPSSVVRVRRRRRVETGRRTAPAAPAYDRSFAAGACLMTPAPDHTPAASDGLPVPQRYGAMAVILLGIAMSVLDGTIVNLALPGIVRDFHADAGAAVWVITAYQVATLVLLLPLAMLGDLVGHRRVYLGGLALFTLASIACAFSPSLGVLVAARTVQGLGAAGLMAVNGALVRRTYPSKQLGRGIALNSIVVAHRLGGRPVDRGRRALGRLVAVAVRHQRAVRHRRARTSAGGRCRAMPRRARPGCACARSTSPSTSPCSASPFLGADALGTDVAGSGSLLGPRAGALLLGGAPSPASSTFCASARGGAALPARPAAHPGLRPVDVHLGRRLRGAVAGLRRAALLLLEAYGRAAHRRRPADHRVADRDTGLGAASPGA